jgi:lysophospholipase L1-like esterase
MGRAERLQRSCVVALLLAACGPVRVAGDDPRVDRFGRFEADGRFVWSATRFSLRFTGRSVRAQLSQVTRPTSPEGAGQLARFRFELDGDLTDAYADERTNVVTFFRNDLPDDGDHHLTVLRQSEALIGETKLDGFELERGAKVLAWDRPARHRIEFIGDSVTVGFGDEGRDPCKFASTNSAITAAFPFTAARALNADFTVLGWSGHGVTRNWGDRPEPVVPAQWTPAPVAPDVVLVALGANDFWNGDPGEEKFVGAYHAFIDRVRGAYPKAEIYSVLTPTGSQARRDAMRKYLGEVPGARYLELSPVQPEDGKGCIGHPSVKTHQRAADEVIARLRADLGW